LRGAKFASGLANLCIFVAERGCGEQGGVNGPRFADGQRAYGNASRHLGDGKQRVESLEGFGLDRYAENRQSSLRGSHAREMRGAAGTGDDDLDAALFGLRGVREKKIGRAVRGDHTSFMRNAQIIEGVRGVRHGFPVGDGAHDDADERLAFGTVLCWHAVIL